MKLALIALIAISACAQDAKVIILTADEAKEAADAYKAYREMRKKMAEIGARLKEKYQLDFEILFSDDFRAIVPSDSQSPWYRGLGPCVIPDGSAEKIVYPAAR